MASFHLFHLRDGRSALVVMISAALTHGVVIAQHDPEINAVVKAWRDRENRVRSLDFRCEGQCTQLAAYAKAEAAAREGRGPYAPKAKDDRTTTFSFETKFRFVFDARGRSRLETLGAEFSSTKNALVPVGQTEVFDGKLRKTFFDPAFTGFPNFHIQAKAGEPTQDLRTLALAMVYRPFDREFAVFTSDTLSIDRDASAGSNLVVSDRHGFLTVDRDREYLPVRYSRLQDHKVKRELTIEYTRDQEHGWVPSAWNRVELSRNGAVIESYATKVRQYSINASIPDDAFDIEYPSGTWVQNYITNERYIVREGGQKRPVLPGEYDGTNYEQLLTTDPPTQRSRASVAAVLVALLVSLVLVVAMVVWQVHKRRRAART